MLAVGALSHPSEDLETAWQSRGQRCDGLSAPCFYLSASDWFYASSDVHTVVARKRQGVRLPLEARSLDRSGPLGQPRVWQAHRPGDYLVRLLGLKSNLLYYCKARMAR